MKPEPSELAGKFIRDHVSGETDSRAHVLSRTRFVEAAARTRDGGVTRRRASIFAAAVALVAILALGAHALRSPMTFARGPGRAPGIVSEYMVSPPADELPLYFSDGSVVTLAPAARARVEKTTPNGALLLVESGRLSANVVHRSESDWRFLAGPFSVHVTGTAFVLTWQPAGVLDVDMKSGVVVVTGPGALAGVEVRDHRQFVVPNATAASSSAPAALPEPSVVPPEPAVLAPELPTSPARVVKPTLDGVRPSIDTRSDAAEAPRQESWSDLVARGEYARVLSLANARGLDATLGSGMLDDLAALADAARFSGDRGVAERSLREIRSRFPGTGRAESSAFLLGRLADDAGDARSAVSWYERYLNEAPSGSLAADALGRRMLALRRLNDLESARRAALEYLQRFPTGPHAKIARDLVSR